jgi:AraC-like DNA-binding protein
MQAMNITQGMVDYPVEHLKLALLTSGLSQSLLVAVILLAFATSPRDPRFILGIFLALYGMTFVGELGVMTGFIFAVPHLIVPLIIAPIFLGPTLYVYICVLVGGQNQLTWPWLLRHAIAPAIGTVIALSLLFAPVESLGALPGDDFEPQTVSDLIVSLMALLVLGITAVVTLVYLIKSYLRLHRHDLRIRAEYSNLDRKTLGWIRFSLINLGLFWVATMAADWMDFTDTPSGSVALAVWELLIFYVMAILGIRQKVVFGSPPSGPGTTVFPNKGGPNEAASEDAAVQAVASIQNVSKYAKSGLSRSDMERISAKIRAAMDRDHIYENGDLSLTQLSRHIGVQPPYVSQTLTQEIGVTFYDFIAQARIAAAMEKLADPNETDSILDIAMTVGFNSKSTFNAAFKRVCGVTPSEWRRNTSFVKAAANG